MIPPPFFSSSHKNGEIFWSPCPVLLCILCFLPKVTVGRADALCQTARSTELCVRRDPPKLLPGFPYVRFLFVQTHQRNISCVVANQIFYLPMCELEFFPNNIMAQKGHFYPPCAESRSLLKISTLGAYVCCLFAKIETWALETTWRECFKIHSGLHHFWSGVLPQQSNVLCQIMHLLCHERSRNASNTTSNVFVSSLLGRLKLVP
jgi:hypothetical protein